MFRILSLIAFTCSLSIGITQSYSILTIPDSLLKGANAVKRIDEHKVDVKNKGNAVYRYKQAYTVLNEKADYLSQQQEYYDGFKKLNKIDVTLYDALGNKIKSLKKSDIQDLSVDKGGTGISDNRLKQFGFYHKQYPYTIEFEVEIEYDGLMFLPGHFFYERSALSFEQSLYQVSFPADAPILYKSYNYPGQPVVVENGSRKTITWQMQNQRAVVGESYAPPWYEITPSVFIAMKDFEMDGYRGSYDSWEAFGNFMYQLKKDRDVLPYELKQLVQATTAGLSSKREKVESLYRLMQQNTRYISVQLGIGGWQPYDAKYVYERKYGDCKALTNYMYAMLKEAGIASDYALVKSGSGVVRFKPDFPSSQFDHVILAVPLEKDTMWLECTSQTNAPGYLGDFTNGRYALLVKEKGSKLVQTPDYDYDANKQIIQARVDLKDNGSLHMEMDIIYTGLQHDNIEGDIIHLSEAEMLTKVHDRYSIGTYKVNNYQHQRVEGFPPAIRENISIESTGYAQRTGKRIFITPNIVNRSGRRLQADTARIYEVVITFPYHDIDSVRISIPEGFEPEAMPADKKIASPFGDFSLKVLKHDDHILYIREMKVYKGRHPATAYNDFVKWHAAINKSDASRLVFVQKQ